MIFDAIPYAEYLARVRKDRKNDAIRSFIEFIERRLGMVTMYPVRLIPFGRVELTDTYATAIQLQEKGVIKSFDHMTILPDEPRIQIWNAVCNDPWENISGGISSENDSDAFTASLAEGLERYLLNTQQDYLRSTKRETVEGIGRYGAFIAPEKFTGFSKKQRQKDTALQLSKEASYLWTRGTSLITNKPIYLPAQIVALSINPLQNVTREPLIRRQSTIGIATWPTQLGARLAGMLEVIEHDAYMIMWLNQLRLPRIPVDVVRNENRSLDKLIKKCERYMLKVHAIQMLTDAPTHAICVLVEDQSGIAPRFTFGLKAHRSLPHALEKALLEALRTRIMYRSSAARAKITIPQKVEDIGHTDRIYYWGDPQNASKLTFLIQGKVATRKIEEWEKDTSEEHFARLLAWCRENNYECASVDLGISAMNPTRWCVEMVVMPDMQPTHLSESPRHEGGARLKNIPLKFGYSPRGEVFVDSPHPFW